MVQEVLLKILHCRLGQYLLVCRGKQQLVLQGVCTLSDFLLMMCEQLPCAKEVFVDLTPVIECTGTHVAVDVTAQVIFQCDEIADEPGDVVSLGVVLIFCVSLESSAIALK